MGMVWLRFFKKIFWGAAGSQNPESEGGLIFKFPAFRAPDSVFKFPKSGI